MAFGFVLITLAVIAGSTWAFIELKDRLDRRAQDRDLLLHLGHLSGHGLPARHRRMARPKSRHHDRRGALACSAVTWAAHARLGDAPDATMKLLITGVSHKTAPVEIRECLAFPEAALPGALAELKSRDGVAEAMILSTCNRVEITVTTDDRVDPQVDRRRLPGRDARSRHRERLGPAPLPARRPGRHPSPVPRRRQPGFHGGRRAADSGPAQEPPTPRPRTDGTLCGWLDGVLTRAFSVAKRVRSETGIGQMAVSVSYAAVELARKIFGSLDATARS